MLHNNGACAHSLALFPGTPLNVHAKKSEEEKDERWGAVNIITRQ